MAYQFAALLCFVLLALQNGVAVPSQQPRIYVTSDPSRGWDNSSCWYGGEQTPCSTLVLAFKGVQFSNLSWHPWVYLEKGSHGLDECVLFSGKDSYVQNIGIIGLGSGEQDVVINCTNSTFEEGGGLSFINISNITVQRVWFHGCGILQNSTSTVDFYRKHGIVRFVPVYSALYFLLCKNLYFKNVWVTDSEGNGMTVYATVGSNSFTNCNFSYNQLSLNHSHDAGGGGGFYLEFPFCVPTHNTADCSADHTNVPPEYANSASYLFENCSFIDNHVSIPNRVNTTFILPGGLNHMGLGRGGGLSIFFKGNVSESYITVNGCHFIRNSAFWGGGLFVAFQDNSQHNNLTVLQSLFEGNQVQHNIHHNAGTGGGGARLDYIFDDDATTKSNNMTISYCHYHNNTAYFGGGVSVVAAREHSVHNATNSLEFVRCKWTQNRARLGAAIDISMWHPVLTGTAVKTTFIDTIIANHMNNSNLEVFGSLVGLGAMYVDSLPVIFRGFVNFTNNHHTALAATNAEINFDKNCTVNFSNNFGRYGGAIFLVSGALIQAYPGSSFRFSNNLAALHGGAIFSSTLGERNLISSRSCFIRYQDITAVPIEWNVNFEFENNTDLNGNNPNSIFTSSLVPCIWGGTYGPYDPEQINNTFCWTKSNWYYTHGCDKEIATAPVTFNKQKHTLELIPGEWEKLDIVMRDDLKHDVSAFVLTASLVGNGTSDASLDPSSLYVSDNALKMYGKPGSTVNVSLHTLSPKVVNTEVTVTLLPCPPGYIGSNSNSPDNKCTCGNDSSSYGGRIRCHNENGKFRSRLVSEGLWIGKLHHDDELPLVGSSPYTFYSSVGYSNKTPWFPLNGLDLENGMLVGKTNNSDCECGPTYRNGVLCAGCLEGYGHAINNKFMKCVDCTKSSRSLAIVSIIFLQLLPLTAVFIILLVFHIRLTSGPANAFIFFSQTITASFALYHTNLSKYFNIVQPWYVVYSVWNLRFQEIFPNFCLSQHLNTATLISLEYISAFFPLILIGIFYAIAMLYNQGVRPVVYFCRPLHSCIARIRGQITLQRSLTDGLAAFLLLSYTKFTIVSLRLLSPSDLYDYWGNHTETVMYYDGTIRYLSPQHAPFISLALVSLAIFVVLPPILLFLYPMKCIQKCLSSGRIKLFLNAFYGCYKDGTEGTYNWRYFAALYFVFRIVFAVTHSLVISFGTLYLVQQLLCTAGILLFAVCRPYTEDFYNNLDAAMFGLLAAINALSSYDYHYSLSSVEKSPLLPVETFLIWLPMAYILSYLVYYFYKTYKIKDKCVRLNRRRSERDSIQDNGISDNSLCRLVDERNSPAFYNSGTFHPSQPGTVNSEWSVSTEAHVFPPSSSDEADDSGHSDSTAT